MGQCSGSFILVSKKQKPRQSEVIKLKRKLYGLPLILLAVLFVYIEWFWLGALVAGFLFGFVIAVDMMYKKTTGKSMDDDAFTEILEKLLP
jgi:Flp pilus assembly protein TadB